MKNILTGDLPRRKVARQTGLSRDDIARALKLCPRKYNKKMTGTDILNFLGVEFENKDQRSVVSRIIHYEVLNGLDAYLPI